MGLVEEGGKVGTAAVGAMSSQPLAIALLIVNIGFLAFAGFVLGRVSENAAERNKSQTELITKLAEDLRNCTPHQGPASWTIEYPPSPL